MPVSSTTSLIRSNRGTFTSLGPTRSLLTKTSRSVTSRCWGSASPGRWIAPALPWQPAPVQALWVLACSEIGGSNRSPAVAEGYSRPVVSQRSSSAMYSAVWTSTEECGPVTMYGTMYRQEKSPPKRAKSLWAWVELNYRPHAYQATEAQEEVRRENANSLTARAICRDSV